MMNQRLANDSEPGGWRNSHEGIIPIDVDQVLGAGRKSESAGESPVESAWAFNTLKSTYSSRKALASYEGSRCARFRAPFTIESGYDKSHDRCPARQGQSRWHVSLSSHRSASCIKHAILEFVIDI